jgi:hypothetical protein
MRKVKTGSGVQSADAGESPEMGRFKKALGEVLKVSKEELDRREAEWKTRKRAKSKA